MIRANTRPEPSEPTATIVTYGPFRYSRNPIYLGFTLFYLGLALWRRSLPTLVLLPAVILLLRRGVIRREEAYLTRRFGPLYTDYQARVRRWL